MEVFVRPNVERDGHKGGPFQQIRHDADLMSFFISIDPDDQEDLGAHIDYHMGTGEDEEIVDVDESVCMFVPKGEVNCPVDISDVRRPFLQLNILTQPTKDACYIEHLYHPFPKEEEEKEEKKENEE
ncbi:MAG: hypothetical protein LUF35_08055 [Lachnospiraceae bacterium]|nr:hypothetical protein [Lachnospiraceae bacterium]